MFDRRVAAGLTSWLWWSPSFSQDAIKFPGELLGDSGRRGTENGEASLDLFPQSSPEMDVRVQEIKQKHLGCQQ